MNTFMDNLKQTANLKRTENGAIALSSTHSDVYDMFAFCGAYRKRTPEDKARLFRDAYAENPELALKCLFYARDPRGGQGERDFFRVGFKELCWIDPDTARANLENIIEYGRWDDLFYAVDGTPLWHDVMEIIAKQLALDLDCKTPSLMAKWLPSENASSIQTKRMAGSIRKQLGLTHKEYRKVLSALRKRINVLERLMSANRWDEIEFDKIPSKAGLVYKNAFARRDIIAKKYEAFARSEEAKVNADTLYPYEIVRKALQNKSNYWWGDLQELSEVDRLMIEKYWNNQIDYFNGNPASMICVVDTSGSMMNAAHNKSVRPIDVAISLGIYCAERMTGPFANHYISFASRPQLIEVKGRDLVDKVRRIYETNLVDDTNLEAVFDLLLTTAKHSKVEDIPKTVVIISDMEINDATGWEIKSTEGVDTLMAGVRAKWAAAGYECPKLVYWNVDARNNTILDGNENTSFVSGCSPVLFEQIITGVTGYDLMVQKLMSERYAKVKLATKHSVM